MIGGLLLIILGVASVHFSGADLLKWYRSRGRYVDATAEITGLAETWGSDGPSSTRAPRFRFETIDGRSVEAVSDMGSLPYPEVGKQVRIVYDPSDPEGTAERTGVRRFQLAVLLPLLLAFGIAFILTGASLLW